MPQTDSEQIDPSVLCDTHCHISKEFVKKAHKASLSVYAWTVDDIEIARKLKKMGVDGITSNKPDFLMGNL